MFVCLVVSIVVSAVVGYFASYAAIMHASLSMAADIASKKAELDSYVDAKKKEIANYSEVVKAAVLKALSERVSVNYTEIPVLTQRFNVYVHVKGVSYKEWVTPYLNITIRLYVNSKPAGVYFFNMPSVFADYDFKAGEVTYTGPWGIKIINGNVELAGYVFDSVNYFAVKGFTQGENLHIYIDLNKNYGQRVEVKLEKAP